VDSQAFERSALERKDREELATIVAALGGKASSRARKAQLVDQILELAGVVEPAGDGPADDGPAGDADEAPEGATAPSGADDEGAGGDAGDEGAAEAAPPRRSRRVSKAQGGQDGEGSVDAAAPGRGRRDDQARRPDEGGRGRGGDDQGERQSSSQDLDHNRAEGGADDGEPGNRRRRRRGRDRGGDDLPPAEPVDVAGLLDLRDDGYGFLRVRTAVPSKDDVYVSVKQVRQFGLRKGDHLTGSSRPAGRNEKNPALLRIDTVNGGDPEAARQRPSFDDLTPLYPDERLRLERPDGRIHTTTRVMDLLTPIGKGQRGLIVSPPKAGKTTIMKEIARSIERNAPDVELIVLLLDERPEEVTDFSRSLERGEVVSSTFDRPAEEHTMVAELTIERAKRLVEQGRDVVIIVDGITRLARAYNLAAPGTGRIMSGGIDTGALYPPKRFFGAARNVEEGGSLTILATALVETGSKMDEVIFEEFKGTGNMELKLDRRLAERRVYPAIDVDASSTRHEELLYERKELNQVWALRRLLSGMAAEGGTGAGIEMLVERLADFETNAELLAEMAKARA
jgi:transcription termination factor Rho